VQACGRWVSWTIVLCNMIHSIAGLNVEHVSLVIHALGGADSNDLGSLFITSLAMIDAMLALLLKEMFSTRKHILYWSHLAKSTRFELLLYLFNSNVFKTIFATKGRDYLILNESELMLRHAEMLRCDLDDLSVFLNCLCNASAELKAVFLQLSAMGGSISDSRRKTVNQCAPTSGRSLSETGLSANGRTASVDDIGVQLGLSMSALGGTIERYAEEWHEEQQHALGLSILSEEDEAPASEHTADDFAGQQQLDGALSGGERRAEELRIIREITRTRLEKCLLCLADSFAEYLPHLLLLRSKDSVSSAAVSPSASAAASSLLHPSGKRSDLSVEELEVLFCSLEQFVDELRVSRANKVSALKCRC
jgi:hypothetical protein